MIDEASDGVEHRFEDAIASIDDDEDGSDVDFMSGSSERFNLVIFAEGIGSSTRQLVFGDEARIEPCGLSSAYFSVPKRRSDGRDARWFNARGGQGVLLRPDPDGTTRAVVSMQQNLPEWYGLLSRRTEAKSGRTLRRCCLGNTARSGRNESHG